MLGFKSSASVEIYIVQNYVVVEVIFINMNCQHILIFVIEKCLAKLLTDKQCTFGSDLSRGKRLYYVLGFISASSCADCLSDISELF